MIFFNFLFIFILGTCFGSFLNVLVDRTQKGKTLKGNSKCDFCGYKLRWFDNIPIFSFLFLNGKCRECKKKLSWQYPIIEGVLGFLFVLICWKTGVIFGVSGHQTIFKTSFLLITSFLFLAIFLWDLKYMIIPNELVFAGLVIAIIYYFYQFLILDCSIFDVYCIFNSNFIGGLITFLFFYLMFYFSKGRWIGGGDVKLGFWIGFLVGWEKVYLMLLISYLLGAVVALLLILRKKKKLKSQIPFGPFLLIGCFIVLFWGDVVLDYYYKMIL